MVDFESVFDGAELVRVSGNHVWVWHGGPYVNVYARKRGENFTDSEEFAPINALHVPREDGHHPERHAMDRMERDIARFEEATPP